MKCRPVRPLRADAARNRARVLEVAYRMFADEGLSVPIDDIARRAGVGAGTVYRHFPTKDDLYRAVIKDRLRHVTDAGRELLASDGQRGDSLFTFLRSMGQCGDTDRGLVEALAGIGFDINAAVPGAEAEFLDLVGGMLRAAQSAGTVREDVTVPEVKALMVACQAAQGCNADVADRVVELVLDGLRPR